MAETLKVPSNVQEVAVGVVAPADGQSPLLKKLGSISTGTTLGDRLRSMAMLPTERIEAGIQEPVGRVNSIKISSASFAPQPETFHDATLSNEIIVFPDSSVGKIS